MCAQLNSPLGPSHNNKQSVTSNTRLHYQLNYQLTLIRTRAWNEFGCNPASFFCCVPEHSCEWVFLHSCMWMWITGHKNLVSAFHGAPSLFLWKKPLGEPGSFSITGTQIQPPLSSDMPVISGQYLNKTIHSFLATWPIQEISSWEIRQWEIRNGQWFFEYLIKIFLCFTGTFCIRVVYHLIRCVTG